jgi:hypothetical protein
MKTIISLFVLMSMSITGIYGQQKEEIYVFRFNGKSPGYYRMAFIVVDKDSTLVKAVDYDVGFSYKNKKLKYIRKMVFNPTERYKYEKLETGNIRIKDRFSGISVGNVDYYTTENFRETDKYVYFKKYLPELAEMDNYEMLEYLDKNFTKYYGPKEYRDVPVLKKQE